jgi:hypothetical protein
MKESQLRQMPAVEFVDTIPIPQIEMGPLEDLLDSIRIYNPPRKFKK